ncbi:5-formyltetrahydrofolate cyclo-ligase [Maribacter hydrothermalis]|uniref:5-formyltetrahydrofolate cyclo-ligase n=1 Tax=Maribacter hydrothermalis TaxID=1836467 RepID=A0A1B7Z3T7_9FLAO|nr:5-formyltetrahydrofolate cyclo-ligase [Maribacter hydrothermalis]APQ17120.1 5-formyltetrahydrofolate cyclo-ligase [Maribacter hydrothermalis]OBR37381.1 5-formyltetrahydrofolate cyclo-ligase [Maribacter hydrothermalis]
MLKKDLRIKYSRLRSSLNSTLITQQSIAIANSLLQLPIWDNNYFHIFLPIQEKLEIDTEGIISIISGYDKNAIVPKVVSATELEHFLLTDNTKFIVNDLKIPEPVDGIRIPPHKIDVVFIPLLAFDEYGNRIGYGKGYYDRFLNQCREDVIKIGLSLFEAEKIISDILPTDIPLNYCVTPNKIYSF